MVSGCWLTTRRRMRIWECHEGGWLINGMDRAVMYDVSISLGSKRSAFLYFGEMPKHICINLGLFY